MTNRVALTGMAIAALLFGASGYYAGKHQDRKELARYLCTDGEGGPTVYCGPDMQFGAKLSKPMPLRVDEQGNMVFKGNKLIGGAACINPDKELGCASLNRPIFFDHMACFAKGKEIPCPEIQWNHTETQ